VEYEIAVSIENEGQQVLAGAVIPYIVTASVDNDPQTVEAVAVWRGILIDGDVTNTPQTVESTGSLAIIPDEVTSSVRNQYEMYVRTLNRYEITTSVSKLYD